MLEFACEIFSSSRFPISANKASPLTLVHNFLKIRKQNLTNKVSQIIKGFTGEMRILLFLRWTVDIL
jgi:hypothetical protein